MSPPVPTRVVARPPSEASVRLGLHRPRQDVAVFASVRSSARELCPLFEEWGQRFVDR